MNALKDFSFEIVVVGVGFSVHCRLGLLLHGEKVGRSRKIDRASDIRRNRGFPIGVNLGSRIASDCDRRSGWIGRFLQTWWQNNHDADKERPANRTVMPVWQHAWRNIGCREKDVGWRLWNCQVVFDPALGQPCYLVEYWAVIHQADFEVPFRKVSRCYVIACYF